MTLRREAIAFLRGAATDMGGELALALARAVLRDAADAPGGWTRLALDIRDADARWATKAVTLAAMVLDAPDADEDVARASGGRP